MIELLDSDGLSETADRLNHLGATLVGSELDARGPINTASGAETGERLRRLLQVRGEWAAMLAEDLHRRAKHAIRMEGSVGGAASLGRPRDRWWQSEIHISDRHRRTHAQWHRLEAQKRAVSGLSPDISSAIARSLSHRQAELIDGFTRQDWTAMALLEAGIDLESWDPTRGLTHNERTVVQVYEFYGRAWLGHPELEWAAMANMVGPTFYAGWQDLRAIQGFGESPLDRLLEALTFPSIPRVLPGTSVPNVLDEIGDAEMAWLERTMLEMQRQIFLDLAWQHTAYSWGGPDALADVGLPAGRLAAWAAIGSGVPALVRLGNVSLLRREQEIIIQDEYDLIRGHNGPVGEAMTYLLTWTADNPIPGGLPYRDVVNRRFEVPAVGLDMPQLWPPTQWWPVDYDPIDIVLPRGNIADFDDRWEWITVDMLPAFFDVMDDRQLATSIITTPVAERAAAERRFP